MVITKSGSRGDDVEWIADHIGEDECYERTGATGASQLAALNGAEPFADGIELIDVGAGRAESTRDLKEVVERNARSRRRKER